MKSWTFAIPQLRPLSRVSERLTQAIAFGMIFSLGIAASNLQGIQATSLQVNLLWQVGQAQTSPVAITLPSTGLQDGVYVYGRDQEPGQIRTEYMVFQVRQQQVTGAVYEPRSAYDCFQGTIKANQLDVQVLGYGDQIFEHQVNLNAYHALPQVTANDSRLLSECLNTPTLTASE